MNKPPSTSTQSAPTLDYERQGGAAIDGVHQDGTHVVVRRGGDISRYCVCCGRPSGGKPIVKHLFSRMDTTGSGSGFNGGGDDPISAILAVIGLIILLFYLIVLVSEIILSRSRTVTFGLCDQHHRSRRNLTIITWGNIAGGILLTILGIYLATHPPRPATTAHVLAWVGAFVAAALTWMAAIIFGNRVPTISLVKEKNGLLWIKGAGDLFRKAQPALPPQPPAKK